MLSLNEKFSELRVRLKQGRDVTSASFEPIYYLVFDPGKILAVKRELPAWRATLINDGWEVHQFSIAEAIADIFESARLRNIWLNQDKKDPLAWQKTNQSLANYLEKNKPLQERLMAKLETLAGRPHVILLVTDIEALHPYMRIGVLENEVFGKFRTPSVIFYPGTRTGKTRLKFLGFYPEDGNYRSVHIG
jgi:hypothetical protein